MGQLATPKEAETPLGFAEQKSRIKAAGGAERRLIVVRGGGEGADEWGGRTWEGPSVRSHWGQATPAAFSKANSPEEQSTSPVTVDEATITSARVAPSHFYLSHFKIHTAHKQARAMKCYTAALVRYHVEPLQDHRRGARRLALFSKSGERAFGPFAHFLGTLGALSTDLEPQQ